MKNKIKNLILTGIAIFTLVLTGMPYVYAKTENETELRGRGGSAKLNDRNNEIETRGRIAEGEAPRKQDNLTNSINSSLNIRREDRRLDRREDRREDRQMGRREDRRDENNNLGVSESARLSNRSSNDNRGHGSINDNKGRGGTIRLQDRISSNNSEQNSKGGATLRKKIRFSGTAINGEIPKGHADFRILSRNRGNRLNVSVQNVELADGTLLDVSACGMKVGTISLKLGRGQISIQEKNGGTVPTCGTGKTVSVANGTNTILSGAF